MSTAASLTPIIDHFRDRMRARRDARRADLALRGELAQYTSASDIRELEAILDRHDGVDADEIRSLLQDRKAS